MEYFIKYCGEDLGATLKLKEKLSNSYVEVVYRTPKMLFVIGSKEIIKSLLDKEEDWIILNTKDII